MPNSEAAVRGVKNCNKRKMKEQALSVLCSTICSITQCNNVLALSHKYRFCRDLFLLLLSRFCLLRAANFSTERSAACSLSLVQNAVKLWCDVITYRSWLSAAFVFVFNSAFIGCRWELERAWPSNQVKLAGSQEELRHNSSTSNSRWISEGDFFKRKYISLLSYINILIQQLSNLLATNWILHI